MLFHGQRRYLWFPVGRRVGRQALGEEFTEKIRADAAREANGSIGEDEVGSPIGFGIVEIG